MSKVRFELNREGVRELLRSDAMMGICKEYAEEIRNKCGDDYEVTTHRGAVRVNASTQVAVEGNLKNNTLLRSLGIKSQEERNGAKVHEHWRTLKDGRKVLVRAYRRR